MRSRMTDEEPRAVWRVRIILRSVEGRPGRGVSRVSDRTNPAHVHATRGIILTQHFVLRDARLTLGGVDKSRALHTQRVYAHRH